MVSYPLFSSQHPFTIYRTATDGDAILDKSEADIKRCYTTFQTKVKKKSTHNYTPHGFVDPIKSRLKKLYFSDCEAAKEIRKHHSEFTSIHRRVYHNRCPYCNLSEANTIEHILPKDAYPELAIHVHNLIPCCSKCNSHKGLAVKDTYGVPHTLNLYYHDPEEFEYLEVDCQLDKNGFPKFNYRLDFPQNINSNLPSIITNHYTRLHLLERYNAAVISLYTELEDAIRMNIEDDIHSTLEKLKGFAVRSGAHYGLNHYRTALLRCLLSSTSYHTYLSILFGKSSLSDRP